jgi:hypothetical protein
MGPLVCPETLVTNFQLTLCNIPEERRPNFMYANVTQAFFSHVLHIYNCMYCGLYCVCSTRDNHGLCSKAAHEK